MITAGNSNEHLPAPLGSALLLRLDVCGRVRLGLRAERRCDLGHAGDDGGVAVLGPGDDCVGVVGVGLGDGGDAGGDAGADGGDGQGVLDRALLGADVVDEDGGHDGGRDGLLCGEGTLLVGCWGHERRER